MAEKLDKKGDNNEEKGSIYSNSMHAYKPLYCSLQFAN